MKSLYEELAEYNQKRPYPFHMPGHKGNLAFLPPIALSHLDVTELENTDNLHNPKNCIKETEERISKIYEADRSFLLVNGSTAGLVAAIGAICKEGDSLAVARNCHKAVYSGMILSGAKPIYFWPGEGEIPKAKAVVITSPTYEGNVLDIGAIAKEVHSWGGILIVDEAHGAHFPFHEAFPKGALLQGADVVVHSFHKTLPAFSQSAALHINNGFVVEPFQKYLSYIQTSSPSYLIMSTTDYMLSKLQSELWHFENYVKRLQGFRSEFSHMLVPNDDIGKLLLCVSCPEKNPGIAFEMSTDNYTLAMTSVADTDEGFEKLKAAIKHSKIIKPQKTQSYKLPETILSPREASYRKTYKARIGDSIGLVAGSFVAPFPPGIPILAPGELIEKEIAQNYLDCEIDVILL